jgi:nitrile hydratase
VTAVRPAQVTPDSAAHFVAEDPQHVYAVTFTSRELWGPGEEFTVTVDLFESYLS